MGASSPPRSREEQEPAPTGRSCAPKEVPWGTGDDAARKSKQKHPPRSSPAWCAGEEAGQSQASAVTGSMIVATSDTRLTGKPPCLACSRTIASFGAI